MARSKGQPSHSRPVTAVRPVVSYRSRREHRRCSTICHRPTDFLASCDCRQPAAARSQSVIRLRVWTTAIIISLTMGCATPHAVLNFTAPSAVTGGSAFTVTVTATIEGKPDTIINSFISFTSSDPAAVLPPRYQFTSADAGSHTWTNGFTLTTPGDQAISASIFDAAGINGSVNVAVSP